MQPGRGKIRRCNKFQRVERPKGGLKTATATRDIPEKPDTNMKLKTRKSALQRQIEPKPVNIKVKYINEHFVFSKVRSSFNGLK